MSLHQTKGFPQSTRGREDYGPDCYMKLLGQGDACAVLHLGFFSNIYIAHYEVGYDGSNKFTKESFL